MTNRYVVARPIHDYRVGEGRIGLDGNIPALLCRERPSIEGERLL